MASGNIVLGVFSALQEAAKAELQLSDNQLGLLQGLAVSIPLAVLSIPVGLAVDRRNRVKLLFWMSAIWTIGTLLTAIAHSMPLLFAARMLAGIGANLSTTIAISIAADVSLPATRGRSLLVLTIGKNAGTALAFALGGMLFGMFKLAGGIGKLVRSFEGLLEVAVPRAWDTRETEQQRRDMLARHLEIAQAVASHDVGGAIAAMDAHFDASIGDLIRNGDAA